MKKPVIALCALAAASAQAGVKYWDNQAFKAYDADAYVQDGLVLNYDGIRNQGLGQPHSTNTTTWVNIANPGYFDLSRYDKATPMGGWTDVGFAFTNQSSTVGSYFQKSTGYAFPAEYSLQTLLDAKVADQSNATCTYVMFNGGTWQKSALAIRTKSDYNYSYYFVCDTVFGESTRPRIVKSSKEYTYGTAIVSGNTATFFEGTIAPTSGDLNSGYASRTASATAQTTDKLAIGGGQGTQDMTGQIKAFRLYHKVLSTDELVWNRAIDDYRFFGTAFSTIPVTNAVIASAVAGLSIRDVPANEPSGCYAVDADGHTFTAPATTNVNGRAYACTGYTLETWDDATGDWGAAEDHSGSLSCAATCTSRIRITWQWAAGDGIVTRYDVGDYVQDGLILHYDGIRNAGADQPHASGTTVWKNLAPNGGWDMTLHVISAEGADPGEWRGDGYHFERQSYFDPDAAFTLPSNQTIQVAVDANGLGQKAYNESADSNEAYIYYALGVAFNKAGSLSLRRDTGTNNSNEWFDWTVHGYGDDSTRPRPCQSRGLPVRYCTAVLADTFGAAFMGSSVPTAQTSSWNTLASRRDFTSGPPIVQNATHFGIGGLADNSGRKFTGTLRNFRFYNRVLTDAELARNRMVDDYRFHGVIPVTNVVVASSRLGMEGSEKIGPYEISGSYTFTAPATRTDARGIEYACAGYTLETWDDSARCWGEPVSYESCSYTWADSTSPAKVRLTWQWEAAGALLTAADYDITDYVAGGLVLNYDGIQNLGADLPGVTNRFSCLSMAWANSAPFGGYDMGFTNMGSTATWLGDSAWTANGFSFTNTSFFRHSGAFTVSPKSTHQTLVEGIGDSLANGGSLDNGDNPRGYVFMAAGAWNKAGSFSFVCNTKDSWVDLAAHGFAGTGVTGNNSRCDPLLDLGANLAYATGIMGDGYMAAFYGTEIPSAATTRWRNPSRLPTSHLELEPATVSTLYLGANGSNGSQAFTGTVKSYRYYDRALTNEELRRNRQVDSARYFGELAFTNVVVAVGDGLTVTATPAAGAYAVEGSYTFSAAAGADTPNGYKLEEWDDSAGAWTNLGFFESLSYTYDAATSPAMVRLTWRKTNPFVMVVR